MILVWLRGTPADAVSMTALANRLQRAYRFSRTPAPEAVTVNLLDRESGAPFSVDRFCDATVSLWQSTEISGYAGLPRGLYLLSICMLALIQARALRLNPLLQPEDLIMDSPCNCLFQRRLLVEEYALLFERPRLCRYCLHFYRSLCTKPEIDALQAVIAHAARCAGETTARTPVASF